MSEGWIKIHRKLQNNLIWTNSRMPFDYRSAWIDLLLLANHRDTEVVFDYEILVVKRGQLITSTRQLAERWKWGKDRVCKYLRLLETQKMITKNSTTKRTLLTIVKYDDFQCDADTGKDTEQTQSRHDSATNKNVKNEKNNNIYTKYIPSFSEFWKNYPRKQDKGMAYKNYLARLNDGYSEEELLTACKNYAAECEREKRESKYIKHATTFLSVNEPFVDYLKSEKGEVDNDGSRHIPRRNEEQRNAEIDETIRRIESGEADADDIGLWES